MCTYCSVAMIFLPIENWWPILALLFLSLTEGKRQVFSFICSLKSPVLIALVALGKFDSTSKSWWKRDFLLESIHFYRINRLNKYFFGHSFPSFSPDFISVLIKPRTCCSESPTYRIARPRRHGRLYVKPSLHSFLFENSDVLWVSL